MIRLFTNIKGRIKDSVRTFKEHPADSLGHILPFLMVITTFVGFVIAYAMFIISGGYQKQVELIKSNGIDGIEEAFTSGTVHIINSGAVANIILIMTFAQLIVLLFVYFRDESKIKKILIIIDLVIGGLSAGIFFLINIIYFEIIKLPDKWYYLFVDSLDALSQEIQTAIGFVLLGGMLVGFIMFIVLSILAKCRWIMGYTAVALLISFAIVPLILLLLENVIPLLVGIVVIIIFGVILRVIMAILVSDAGEGGAVSTGLGTKHASSSSFGGTNKVEHKERNADKNCEYIDLGFLAFKLYRVHGFMHDYIEADNGIGTREVCSLDDFRKGRFHIYDKATGRPIQESEIPWRKTS